MSADVGERSDEVTGSRGPLIFISHDTRDAAIAEAFAKLLSSVSAGVLKSFRSSDKKGNQGIEYGVEWYPEIMKKLETSSDVVCLLTPNSVNRPWILYEAGVAKGKLDTPVHGIAIGIPLQNASSGPFAQFQNSDDSEDALTQLVIQLVRRIPNAEPDKDVVRMQVQSFREKALALAAQVDAEPDGERANDGTSVAKLFEEVKVMFQDLPSRIERRFDPDSSLASRRKRRLSGKLINELMHGFGRDLPEGVGLLIATSQFREEFPWLYDLALEAYRSLAAGDGRAHADSLQRLDHAYHATFEHPNVRDLTFRSKERYLDGEFLMESLHRAISLSRDRVAHRVAENTPRPPSNWTEEQLEQLQVMWAAGKTASEIAEALGSVSRNAVIGKAHRLGLADRPRPEADDDAD